MNRVSVRVTLRGFVFASAFMGLLITAAMASGAPVPGDTVRFEQGDAGITRTAGWSTGASALLSSGSHLYTELPGRKIAVRFTGTGVAVIGSVAPSGGSFRYTIDGGAAVLVSQKAGVAALKRELAVIEGLAEGPHDLLIESVGDGLTMIDAFDVEGVAPALGVAPAPALDYVRIEETSTAVVMSDGWFSLAVPAMSGGTHRWSAYGDSSVRVAFDGTGIAWIGTRHPKFGKALVSIDGAAPVTVDLYAPSMKTGAVLYSASGLAAGDHTLVVTVAGARAAASGGNIVGVDAFEVAGNPHEASTRVEDDDTRPAFVGLWSMVETSTASGNTWRRTSSAGAFASLAFEGEGVSLRAPRGPGRGRVRVELDGTSVATVDLAAIAEQPSAVVWSSGALPAGEHVLRVTTLDAGAVVDIDAFDVEGFVAAALLSKLIDQTDSRIWYAGSWSGLAHSGAHGGTLTYAKESGSAIHVRFTGTAFEWLGRTHPGCGTAKVFVDDVEYGTVDLSRGAVAGDRRILWSIRGLANKEHVVRIVLDGAAGRGSGPTVSIDGVRTDGTLLASRPPTPFSYPWKTYIVIDKSDYKLYWVKDGYLWGIYPIAHGKAGTPTPTRVWRIDAKYKTDPTSVYGPRKMRLFKQVWNGSRYVYVYTAYAIHGTNQEWVIGTMASHGCIRMYNKDVLALFPQVPVGTMVVTRD